MRRLFVFLLSLSILGSISAFPGQPTVPVAAKAKEDPARAKYDAAKGEHDKAVKATIEKARATPRVAVTKLGQEFKLVDPEQLRLPKNVQAFGAAQAGPAGAALPRRPDPNFDWTARNSISFPILGNRDFGDCFYTASAHLVQTWTGMNGRPTAFDPSAVVNRYLQLSPGDRGLFPTQMLPEFERGIIGPDGRHKILDHSSVPVRDPDAILLTQWAFGGTIMTCQLRDSWRLGANAGDTWDDDGTAPNPEAGHAMVINGMNADGTYKLQTWGFNPPIHLTRRGLENCGAQLIACFSLEWFDPATGRAPNGLHYNDLAALWKSLGGKQLPPNPFPDPPTPVVPTPVVPKVSVTGKTVTVTIGTDVFVLDTDKKTATLPAGWNGAAAPGGDIAKELATAGVKPEVITPVMQLLVSLRANKDTKTLTDDVVRLLGALPFTPPKK